jgi:heterodisulfide reductase subunit A-like polyferredoxin
MDRTPREVADSLAQAIAAAAAASIPLDAAARDAALCEFMQSTCDHLEACAAEISAIHDATCKLRFVEHTPIVDGVVANKKVRLLQQQVAGEWTDVPLEV